MLTHFNARPADMPAAGVRSGWQKRPPGAAKQNARSIELRAFCLGVACYHSVLWTIVQLYVFTKALNGAMSEKSLTCASFEI